MKASLSELQQNTEKVVRPVIEGGKTVDLTDQGEVRAKIVPIPKIDRKAAWDALVKLGPLKIAPRK
jgi:antitoxin (DNA-binding transcriptional repressor) of toxin-antitoxin stability system